MTRVCQFCRLIFPTTKSCTLRIGYADDMEGMVTTAETSFHQSPSPPYHPTGVRNAHDTKTPPATHKAVDTKIFASHFLNRFFVHNKASLMFRDFLVADLLLNMG